MLSKNSLCAVLCGWLAAGSLLSQTPCATDFVMHKLGTARPDLQEKAQELEEKILKEKAALSKNVRFVPVVFHVMHKYGPENISRQQILDAMEILNKDFRRLNADTQATRAIFKPFAADMNIEFRLATKDPDGNCTDGITRHFYPGTYGHSDECKDPSMGGYAPWDQTRYLNVWVVGSIYLDGFGEAAGYAYYPTWGIDNGYFGVVMAHRYLGNTGTATGGDGRTLTHEMGHIFGLAHTFDEGCGTTCQNSGDYVCDTPPSAAPTYGCNLNQSTCTNDALPGSPFTTNMPDQVENYMSYDACQNMFTLGQKQRAYDILGQVPEWNNLSSAANLAATGVTNPSSPFNCPLNVDFMAARTTLCVGDSVQFFDLSWNGQATSRTWQITGPVSMVSTAESPFITFTQAGLYSVKLICTNNAGSFETQKTQYIRVLETPSSSLSYSEDFETNPFIFGRWQAGGDPINQGWQYFPQAGNPTGASIFLDALQMPFPGDYWVMSPAIHISSMDSPRLAFDVAYARYSFSDNTRLVVQLSKDCGRSWGIYYVKSGESLATVPTVGIQNFIPQPWDWRRESIKIPPSFLEQERLLVRFLVKSDGYSNRIFIDNVNIEKNAGAASFSPEDNPLKVWPVPAENHIYVEGFLGPGSKTLSYCLYSSSGKILSQGAWPTEAGGRVAAFLNISELPNGVYFLVTRDGERQGRHTVIKAAR
ncbi:MAG: M43 family zinc metalloprotease [Flavobacteriales bacterium]|nr:M43 family zinc metalloprotease [Flavobacteriales bacterium]